MGYDSLEDFRKVRASDVYVDPNERIALLNLLKDHGSVFDHKITVLKKDGSITQILLSLRTMMDDDRGVTYLDGIVRALGDSEPN